MLHGPPLLMDPHRRLLPSKNGVVFDFETTTARPVRPSTRCLRAVPWAYEAWQAPASVQLERRRCMEQLKIWEDTQLLRAEPHVDLLPRPTEDVAEMLQLSLIHLSEPTRPY